MGNSIYMSEIPDILARVPSGHRSQLRRELLSLEGAVGDSHQNLLAATSDTDLSPGLRATACWLLARLNWLDKRDVLRSLSVALGDEKAIVRAEALRSLAQLQVRRSVSLLANALQNDPDCDVRKAAAYALGSLGGPTAIRLLKRTLLDAGEAPAVRGMAAEMLGQLGAEQAFGALVEGLGDPHPEVRFWSAFALGALGNLKAIDPLLGVAMNDEATLEHWGSLRDEARDAIRRIAHEAGNREAPAVTAASG